MQFFFYKKKVFETTLNQPKTWRKNHYKASSKQSFRAFFEVCAHAESLKITFYIYTDLDSDDKRAIYIHLFFWNH